MRIKTIVLCGAILLTAGHQEAHAQGFLNKIKKVGCSVRCPEKQMLKSPVKLLI